MMTEYRLGGSIAQVLPFYRRIKDKETITNKLIIIMTIVALVKIAVLMT